MSEEYMDRLQNSLAEYFIQNHSVCLARILWTCLGKEFTLYEELDLGCPDRDEHILTLYEERVLIPVQPGTGSSWTEKSLRLQPGEGYFMPAVARNLIHIAGCTGKFETRRALTETLCAYPDSDNQALAMLVHFSLDHARSYRIEAGLLGVLAQSLDIQLDLHDAVDQFVVSGILSPCKAATLTSGLAWYEINACLFWERAIS